MPGGRYLVTGAAGSGKTTLERIFDQKGYETSDIDDGFAEWRDRRTGDVVDYHPEDPQWHVYTDWSLRFDILKTRLSETKDKPIIIFGSTNDLHKHLDLFDKTFLLMHTDEQNIRERIASREGGYGKNEHELRNILSYYKYYQDRMLSLGAIAVDANLTINDKVRFIEEGFVKA